MIKRIIASIIFVCLLIAIPLSLMGYKQVDLGAPFLAFMSSVTRDLDEFKIAIPDIPTIPIFQQQVEGGFLEVLVNILNVLINFVNMFIVIINTLVQVLNVAIQLLEVIFLVIKNLITFKDSVTPIIV